MKYIRTLALLVVLLSYCLVRAQQSDELYLVTYRMPQSFSQLKLVTSPYHLQNLLVKEVELYERELFGFAKDNVESLWLAQSSLVSLSPKEVKSLLSSPRVLRIAKARRNFRLIEGSAGYTPLTNNYGLKKIKVPEVRGRYWGLDGRGIKVGIVDTGISLQHPEFEGRIVAARDFTGTRPSADDDHGHGSHVAGTIGGNNQGPHEIGVASGVEFVIAKAFDGRGNSDEKGLLRALQWMADPDGDPLTPDAPKVINNSWNNDGDFSNLDPQAEPFCIATENLWRMGIVPVFAAGNDGSASSSIKLPAACPSALSVGATDSSDKIASFSSRGPVKWKSVTLVKPELSAPGVDIFSADKKMSYRSRSGTSMAAPHVVGSLALLLQHSPNLTAKEAASKLLSGAEDLGVKGSDNVFGAGRLDIYRSISE